MIRKCEGLVLHRTDYGDTSLIATVLTDTHGKTAMMVRGGRRPKSPLLGQFEPGHQLQIVFDHKPTREVQNVRESGYAVHRFGLRRSLESMSLLAAAMELVGQVVHGHEPDPAVYAVAVRFLDWLDQADPVRMEAFPALQVRLAEAMGIGIQDVGDDAVGDPAEGSDPVVVSDAADRHARRWLDPASGSLSALEPGGIRLTPAQYTYIRLIVSGRGGRALRSVMPSGELKSLIHHLDSYLGYHIDGIKPRRSDRILLDLL